MSRLEKKMGPDHEGWGRQWGIIKRRLQRYNRMMFAFKVNCSCYSIKKEIREG